MTFPCSTFLQSRNIGSAKCLYFTCSRNILVMLMTFPSSTFLQSRNIGVAKCLYFTYFRNIEPPLLPPLDSNPIKVVVPQPWHIDLPDSEILPKIKVLVKISFKYEAGGSQCRILKGSFLIRTTNMSPLTDRKNIYHTQNILSGA